MKHSEMRSNNAALTIRERIYRLVEPVSNPTRVEQFVDYFLLVMIAISVLTFIIGTVPEVDAQYGELLGAFEILAVTVFTLEYLLRLYACTIDPKYSDPLWGRIRYALTPMMVIDLLAILPFHVAAVGGELFVLRILRLFRLARVLKVNRYSSALTAIGAAWRKKGPELIIAASMMLTLIVIAATLLFYAEQGHHDGERFTSIPDTLWAAVAIVSPLGYDGYFPNTVVGKSLMMIISVFGVAFVALPAGIFAGAFSAQLTEVFRQEEAEAIALAKASDAAHAATGVECPHCGKVVEFS
ncbi:MAG: ion transporter [Candidatus Promineifilaceae bacterium]